MKVVKQTLPPIHRQALRIANVKRRRPNVEELGYGCFICRTKRRWSGKTTTAVNIAAMAATLPPGWEIATSLLCDLDAQMNATHQLGFPELEVNQTIAGNVTGGDLENIIIHDAATIEGLDAPSHSSASYIDEAVR
jgi:hypothetical protein